MQNSFFCATAHEIINLHTLTSHISLSVSAMSMLFIVCQAPKLFPDLYEVLTCGGAR